MKDESFDEKMKLQLFNIKSKKSGKSLDLMNKINKMNNKKIVGG